MNDGELVFLCFSASCWLGFLDSRLGWICFFVANVFLWIYGVRLA